MTFDIVLYPFPLGSAKYPRPCVVIDPSTSDMMAITTKEYAKFNFFTLRPDHPDFAATNLKAASYVIGDSIARPEQGIRPQVIGKLTGQLAEEFAKWLG